LIDHDVAQSDGTIKSMTVKCTRNAAASIALVCSENSYDQAKLILNHLAGLDVTAMTEFRVTDCVGSEFIKDVPAQPDCDKVEEISEKIGGNILETQLELLNESDDKAEIIKKAVEDKPDGVLYKDYDGPVIKVMYIQCDGTGVPGRRQELADAKGKQADGSAKTFERKLGLCLSLNILRMESHY
jgi:hypothetical protein